MKIRRQNSVTKKTGENGQRTLGPSHAMQTGQNSWCLYFRLLHCIEITTVCPRTVIKKFVTRLWVVTCYDWWEDNRQTRTIICSLSLMTAPQSPGNGWFRFDLKLLMWMKLTQKHSNHGFSDSKLPEIDLHPFFPTLPVKWETARKRAVVFSHVKSKASDQNYRFYLN